MSCTDDQTDLFLQIFAYMKNVLYICAIKQKMYNMETKSKRERFEKVAGNRVQKVIDFLTLLQNCANRNNYEYTEEDVEHMFSEIQKTLKETRAKYQSELNKVSKTGFQFNS